jgi:hypothetical protein
MRQSPPPTSGRRGSFPATPAIGCGQRFTASASRYARPRTIRSWEPGSSMIDVTAYDRSAFPLLDRHGLVFGCEISDRPGARAADLVDRSLQAVFEHSRRPRGAKPWAPPFPSPPSPSGPFSRDCPARPGSSPRRRSASIARATRRARPSTSYSRGTSTATSASTRSASPLVLYQVDDGFGNALRLVRDGSFITLHW